MIKELMYKWFGLESLPCPTCEVLKQSLELERQFNKVMFEKLTQKPQAEIPVVNEPKEPMKPRNIPWAVKRQMLEAEDRRAAQVLRQVKSQTGRTETEDLENKLGIPNA